MTRALRGSGGGVGGLTVAPPGCSAGFGISDQPLAVESRRRRLALLRRDLVLPHGTCRAARRRSRIRSARGSARGSAGSGPWRRTPSRRTAPSRRRVPHAPTRARPTGPCLDLSRRPASPRPDRRPQQPAASHAWVSSPAAHVHMDVPGTDWLGIVARSSRRPGNLAPPRRLPPLSSIAVKPGGACTARILRHRVPARGVLGAAESTYDAGSGIVPPPSHACASCQNPVTLQR